MNYRGSWELESPVIPESEEKKKKRPFNLFFIYLFIYLFIYGCVGSSFLCEGFL